MKKYQYINGIKYKPIGYTYDGKPKGLIACGKND
jgi:hypothetical protein